ncbi:SRPBCC family protein [Sphingomonas spermidinifaciens]|nr:SRPBCC family protein [Sphingomonas spermidinifaciens]
MRINDMTVFRFCLAAALLAASLSGIASAQTTAQDLPRRNPEMSWPSGFEPSEADTFNHNKLLIETDCGMVYDILTKPDEWPFWLPIASKVRVSTPAQPMTVGSRFAWSVFNIAIESNVFVAEPGRRFGYTVTPPGPPPLYAQSWLFQPVEQGCLVTTEEMGMGDLAKQTTASGSRLVHVAHDLWLAALRWQSLFGKAPGFGNKPVAE